MTQVRSNVSSMIKCEISMAGGKASWRRGFALGLEGGVHLIKLSAFEQQRDGSQLCLRKTTLVASGKVEGGLRLEAETQVKRAWSSSGAWHTGRAHTPGGKIGMWA